MSELALFDNMPQEYKDLLAQLEPDKNASGGGAKGGTNRLSIRGGVFRKVVNGQEVGELDGRSINIVIVKTSPVSRMFYEGQYVAGQLPHLLVGLLILVVVSHRKTCQVIHANQYRVLIVLRT
jgi:hypothetical protein